MTLPYATPHRELDVARMTRDPEASTNRFAASIGDVLWVDKVNTVTKFGFMVERVPLVAEFVGEHPDLYVGSTVSVLYSPVRNIDGVNAFGGPARAMLVHAWAINGVSGTRYEPWKRDAAEKWQAGTLFAAK